jgi:hypothetical protein
VARVTLLRWNPAVTAELVVPVRTTETIMIRLIAVGTLLAAALTGSNAFAQTSTYQHHTFCLIAGQNKECAYDSMAQCEAAKHGNTDICERNGPPENH